MEVKLGSTKIWKLCFIMGVPSIIAQLINLMYSIVDKMYIGNMPDIGENALAGLGLCSPIIILISAFSSFVSGGGAPLAAKALGENKNEHAKKILGNGMFLLLFFSIILSVIAMILKEPIFYLTGASDETFVYANDYLSIYLLGTVFVQLSVGLNTFITAQGKSGLAMASILIGAFLNIALDPLFIFTFGMGIKGAAIATVISQGISALWVVFILTNKRTVLRLEIKNIKPDMKIIAPILALGVGPFVMASTESLIGFVLNNGLKKYGGDSHVANLTILQSVMMLIGVPLQGFTHGCSPIISYNYGAKNKERIISCFKIILVGSFSYCTLSAIFMMVFPRFFGSMFTNDAKLLTIVSETLPIFIAGMLVFGIQRACQATFIALGQGKVSLFIALLRKVILLVPLAIIMPMLMGVIGIYAAEAIADFIAAITCGTIFFIQFRKILSKMNGDDNLAFS